MIVTLQVGVGRADITPKSPVPLAGFAIRNDQPFAGVSRKLSLTALVFTAGETSAVLVSADILWWPPERVPALKAEIARRWSVAPEAIFLHATHTHGAPQTGTSYPASLGSPDADWCAWLDQQLLAAIEDAWVGREPATLERGTGSSQLGVNRRWLRGDESLAEGETEGPIDRDLTVIRVAGEDGTPLAMLVHLACHPVTTMDPFITSDFVGVMRALLEGQGEPPVMFLQGCCGDINPAITRDRDHRSLNDADVVSQGEQLRDEVRAVLDRGLQPLSTGPITTVSAAAGLPFSSLPNAVDLAAGKEQAGITGEWSRLMLAEPRRITEPWALSLTRLNLGPDLAFLAMDGEVVQSYGEQIKTVSDNMALPLPYTNGMTGYIVTARQLVEGGYEADESTRYFGLPSQFAPEIEANVRNAIDELSHD